MQQEDHDHDARYDGFLSQRFLKRVHRFADDVGAVVERDDSHRHLPAPECRDLKPGLNLLDLVLDAFQDVERILAVTHHNHAAHRLSAGVVQGAAAELWSHLHGGHVTDRDGRPAFLSNDDLAQIVFVFDEADSANEEFQAIVFDHLGANVDVAAANGLMDVHERHAMGPHLVRMHVDLILLDITADAGNFGNAFNRLKLIADVPVLERANLGQVGAG